MWLNIYRVEVVVGTHPVSNKNSNQEKVTSKEPKADQIVDLLIKLAARPTGS